MVSDHQGNLKSILKNRERTVSENQTDDAMFECGDMHADDVSTDSEEYPTKPPKTVRFAERVQQQLFRFVKQPNGILE